MTSLGRLNSVTNGSFQVSEFNDSFPAMNLKSGRSPSDPKATLAHFAKWQQTSSKLLFNVPATARSAGCAQGKNIT